MGEMPLSLDASPLDVLRVALPEAQAWCGPCVPSAEVALTTDEPDSTLRSMRLCPSLFASHPGSLVRSVITRRSYALHDRGQVSPENAVGLVGGRLLLYEPERNL